MDSIQEAELREQLRSSVEVDGNLCFLWERRRNKGGYGLLEVEGKTVYAHRVSYELNVGPVPLGLELDHICRIRHCINFEHLEAVTPRVNVSRRRRYDPKACPQGHEYTEANTGKREVGGRYCRACLREYARARRSA